MTTNGEGSPDRQNAQRRLSGTLLEDIPPGVTEFVRWDRDNLFETPPPDPIEKSGLDWRVGHAEGNAMDEPLAFLLGSIEAGIPPVVCLPYLESGHCGKGGARRRRRRHVARSFCFLGDPLTSITALRKAKPKVPVEDEKQGIGHAVTGVGLINGDPDSEVGPLPQTLWVIVPDNWASTPENIVIPWDHVAGIVVYMPR